MASHSKRGGASWSLWLQKVSPPIHLTPATNDRKVASDWFRRFDGAGLDGVMAKMTSGFYEPNKRTMLKVKHERDCDCVVAGFRWYKKGDRTLVGSLLLGLFDDAGALQHVGVCASFTAEKRRELAEFLEPYRKNALASHPWKSWAGAEEAVSGEGGRRVPGGQEPLEPRQRFILGNRCGPNWLWKSLMSTCKEADSVTWRTSAGGGPIKSRAIVLMRSSR